MGYMFRFISNYYFTSRSGNTDHLINGLLLFREELKGIYLSLNLTELKRNIDAKLAELYQAYEEKREPNMLIPARSQYLVWLDIYDSTISCWVRYLNDLTRS